MCKLGISVRGWSLFCFGNVRNVKNMKNVINVINVINVLKYLYVDLLLFQILMFAIFKFSNLQIDSSSNQFLFHISTFLNNEIIWLKFSINFFSVTLKNLILCYGENSMATLFIFPSKMQ